MPVHFEWTDATKTVLRYRVEGQWNWNDLHKHLARAAFQMDSVDHPVDLLLDLRGSSQLPAGAVAHLRSVGKKQHRNSSERVIIVGLPREVAQRLAGDTREYRIESRIIRFADTEAEISAILQAWRE